MSGSFDVDTAVTDLLRRGFYSMAFQPIWETGTLRPYAFEALLRGPKGTPLAEPGRLFNESGFMNVNLLFRLDMVCIGSAVRTGRNLPSNLKISINIHGYTLKQLSLNSDAFEGLLDELEIAPDRIILEITENTETGDVQDVRRSLRPFRRLGMKVALDDVGTRHTCFEHIFWLEPDYIKVDRTFIQDIDTHARKQGIVHGLSLMSEKVGASLLAEGIESHGELKTVTDIGVPYAQGYLLGRPLPAETWLNNLSESGGIKSVVPGDAK